MLVVIRIVVPETRSYTLETDNMNALSQALRIGSVLLCGWLLIGPAAATNAPESKMMEAVERLARFMETLDESILKDAFAKSNVTIIENFAPYVFKGPKAVEQWAKGFRAHANGLADLHHSFGAAQDFSVEGDSAFLSLPTTWTGARDGKRFSEQGGWAFVLVKSAGEWRVQSYGWAVTNSAEQ